LKEDTAEDTVQTKRSKRLGFFPLPFSSSRCNALPGCREYAVAEHPRVIKWLRKHRNYFSLYQRMKNEVLGDPYGYDRMRGKCSRYRRHKRGELRLVYEVRGCLVVIVGFGFRKNLYKKLGCE